MAVLTPPYALGASGQVLSGRTLRHAVGSAFRPGTGLTAVSGCLVGPANTMGELALPTATSLTVQPFRAVVQNTEDVAAGPYVVVNDAQVTLTVTGQHATQFRRSIAVITVDDSQTAGVASSGTTDRARQPYMMDGALAASSGATVLPTPPANSLVLGEVLIPPTGQTVTLTPYNRRTGARDGILPVTATDVTAPLFDGQYRDHPTNGLERSSAGAWGHPRPADIGAWTAVPTATASWDGAAVTTTAAGASASDLQYRIERGRVVMRGWSQTTVAIPALAALLSTVLPVAARPPVTYGLYPRNDIRPNATLHRHEIGPDGQMYAVVAHTAGLFLNWDAVSWPLG